MMKEVIEQLKNDSGYSGKPEQWQRGFDLVCRELEKRLSEKIATKVTYYLNCSEYVVDHPAEYDLELSCGEVEELEKWYRTESIPVFVAQIYSDEDNWDMQEFATREEAERAAAENKAMIDAMIEAQEQDQ